MLSFCGASLLYSLFGWGAYISIFAGAVGFAGFVIALIIGGESGAALSISIKSVWFPFVIKLTSVAVGLGLVGMYFGKEEALSMASDKKDAEDELKHNLELAKSKDEDKS